MDPDATALSRELADRSPSEREEYYAQQQVPAAIRDEVESLLRFDNATPHSLAGDVTSDAETVLLGGSHQPGPTASGAFTTQQPVGIGRYQVVRFLGRGGMGEVYLARDPVLDRDVAVKLIGGELDDTDARRRLVREARAAGRLRHPNIVTIFDAGDHDGRSFIAMEYVTGETLGSVVRRRAALPLRRKLELIESACAGLAHAHHAGVIHLDIKPDNLMLDEAGIVKVLDFGIARVLMGETLATRHLGGTLRYMSPEQIEGKPVDRRSDVFSLGCSVFEFVAYSPAYAGSTQQIVTRITAGPVPRLLDVVPGIDARLDAIVSRAMALDPSDRYDDMDGLRVELARLRAEIDQVEDEHFVGQPIPVVPENVPSRLTPVVRATSNRASATQSASSRWRSPLTLSIGAVAALAIGVGAFLMWGARAPSETTLASTALVRGASPSESARPSERTEPKATRPGDEVWRRLAIGDRRGVLELLGSTADRGVTPDPRLPYDVLDAARTSMLRTRETAATASGAGSSVPFRSAEDRLARANRLEAAGRPIDALGVLWQAADLYTQASALGQRQAPRTPSGPESPPPTEPAAGSGRVAEPAPPPAVESPRPERLIPSVAEATSPERAASPPSIPPKTPSDTDAILDVLRRYQAAYEALDVSGVVQVFPSLGRDQVEQLRRTFAGMTAYEIEIQNARVDVQTDTASVRAVVVRRMVPRVGRPVANEVETEFRLRRVGSGWVITAATAP